MYFFWGKFKKWASSPDHVRIWHETVQLFHYRKINFFVGLHSIYRVSQKQVWFASPVSKLYLSCATLLYGVLSIFFENFKFFWYFNDPKKSANLFSHKIKSSEEQKCANKLFLSKSKILKGLNYKISENLQNCNKKIRNFQFWYNFYGKIVVQWFLRIQCIFSN